MCEQKKPWKRSVPQIRLHRSEGSSGSPRDCSHLRRGHRMPRHRRRTARQLVNGVGHSEPHRVRKCPANTTGAEGRLAAVRKSWKRGVFVSHLSSMKLPGGGPRGIGRVGSVPVPPTRRWRSVGSHEATARPTFHTRVTTASSSSGGQSQSPCALRSRPGATDPRLPTPLLGSLPLLARLTELRGTWYLLGHQFIQEGHNSGAAR